jgi:predicted RNA-binding protein YlxR (DUF448 family)
MCVACRRVRSKDTLIRVARDAVGAVGLLREGRGAYVCRTEVCVRKAIRGRAFGRALRLEVGSVDWAKLETELLQTITDSNVEG